MVLCFQRIIANGGEVEVGKVSPAQERERDTRLARIAAKYRMTDTDVQGAVGPPCHAWVLGCQRLQFWCRVVVRVDVSRQRCWTRNTETMVAIVRYHRRFAAALLDWRRDSTF